MNIKKLFAPIVLLVCQVGLAGEPARVEVYKTDSEVISFVENSFDEIMRIMDLEKNATQNERFVRGLRARIDMVSVSRSILARHWRRIDLTMKEQFVEVTTGYLVEFFHNYFSLLATVQGEAIEIRRINRYDDSDSLMVTTMVTDIRVDWLMANDNTGALKLQDIIVAGFSVRVALASEVKAAIRQYGGLLPLIQARLVRQDSQAEATEEVKSTVPTGQIEQ